ncbi:3311_t:CDS:1, partial [Racocetra fulgida]
APSQKRQASTLPIRSTPSPASQTKSQSNSQASNVPAVSPAA